MTENAGSRRSGGWGMPRRGLPVALAVATILVLAGATDQFRSLFGAQPDSYRLMILGDSLSVATGIEEHEALPAVLQEALRERGYNVTVIGAGVGGDTTGGGLQRLPGELSRHRPHFVLVELGGNDMLRQIPPTTVYNNLDQILRTLTGLGYHVMLAGMKAYPHYDRRYQEEFNRIFPVLARTYGVAFYPFILEGVVQRPEYMLPDGIHPSAEGVRVMVNSMLPGITSFLRKAVGS